jgi:alpha-mannosidase
MTLQGTTDHATAPASDTPPPATPPAGRATRGPLHMIGNAHIDPVWLWQWPEGYQEVRATFRSALDRMEEYPEFIFTADSVAYLSWVEEHDPELFEAIRRRVAEGRWEIVGGWWVEPDCNIPAGESFVRQALYSQRYLQDRFGVTATVGCNVDPFGHNAMLPQLLRKSGMDSYVFLRPGPHELHLPGPTFWWESADGSRVLAYRIPHEYGSPPGELTHHVHKSLGQLPVTERALMCFYGVGNHGGGPTRANLDSIRRLNRMDQFPAMDCSTTRRFFDAVRADDDLPTWTGELQPHSVGCYSAHSGIKRWNRQAENDLLAAEKWAAVASVLAGVPAPVDRLGHAWRQVLFNQFHDILAGTSIEPAYEDARNQLGEARAIAARIQNRALQSISRRIDIPAEAGVTPLVVFNPHPWPVRTTVELEFGTRQPVHAVDDAGHDVPVQTTRSYALTGGRRRLVLPTDLPPLGYRLYRLSRHPLPGPGEALPADGTALENEHLRVVVDPRTGWLSSLLHKETGNELVGSGGGQHAVVVDDPTDTWGHGVISYRRAVGRFEPTSVRLVENGPVRSILRIESRYGSSSLVEELVLARGARYLEVRATVDWHEQLKALKLRFPTALSQVTATHEIPYGHIRRAVDGHESPSQTWVDVSGSLAGAPAGLSLLNDGKYAFDVAGGEIGMTVLRSPVYAWHDPEPMHPDGIYTRLDKGAQQLTYRLLPHAGDWRQAGTVRVAAELNQQPVPLIESYHPGALPASASYARIEDGPVVVTVLKQAEDDDAIVVRAYESTGRPARATIELPLLGRSLTADFGAAEIKTFRVPREAAEPVAETDLIEWPAPWAQPGDGPGGALA